MSVGQWPATRALDFLLGVGFGAVEKLESSAKVRKALLGMCEFVEAVTPDGKHKVRLVNDDLVDNHVPDGQTLLALLREMGAYNTDFFQNGRLQGFAEGLLSNLGPWLSKALTQSLQSFSPPASPPSEN